MKQGFILAVLILVGAMCVIAEAQVGLPNIPLLQPGKPLPAPFGTKPHPFNDPHPTYPWNHFYAGSFGLVVREFIVPPRTVILPMPVAEPGSLPPRIEHREITLPGYRVTETTVGFIVHEHWAVRQIGSTYYWTRQPTYFTSKR